MDVTSVDSRDLDLGAGMQISERDACKIDRYRTT